MTSTSQNSSSCFDKDFNELDQKIKSLGFDGVLYSFYPKTFHKNSSFQPIIQFSDCYAPFVEHYIKQDYGNKDFVLRLAFRGSRKFIDWWEEIRMGNVKKEEKVVTYDARDNFGIHHGLTIPVLKGANAIAGISVISLKPDLKAFQKIKSETLERLFIYADEYHAKILSRNDQICYFFESIVEHFDLPKKQVLKHILLGKPLKNIDETAPDIAPKSAEKIFANIRKEFGNIKTPQLIYLLGKMDAEKYL